MQVELIGRRAILKICSLKSICENLSLTAIRSSTFVNVCSAKPIRIRAFVKICELKPIPSRTSVNIKAYRLNVVGHLLKHAV